MTFLESQFQTLFGLYIVHPDNKPSYSQNHELKVANGGTFNLKNWRQKQPHQPRSLKQATGDTGIFHKISDMSRGQKPFDSFFSRNTESFLVIYFNKHQEFFMIPIHDVPPDDSISHDYCKENFITRKLLEKEEKVLIDF